jgi:hypothetical protein
LDKIVAYQPSSNKVVNADQLHEEEMEQHFLEALAAGRVRLYQLTAFLAWILETWEKSPSTKTL